MPTPKSLTKKRKTASKPAAPKKPSEKPVIEKKEALRGDFDYKIPVTVNEIHHHNNNIQLMDVLIISLFTVNIVLIGVKIGRTRF